MNLQNASTSVSIFLLLICAPFGRVKSTEEIQIDGIKDAIQKATKESEEAAMPHLSPHPEDDLELGAEHFDQKAFLGSEEKVREFQDMLYGEKVQGLTKLFGKIDVDGNKTISVMELEKWVLNSLKTLKEEEAKNSFNAHDYDEDGKFSWEDNLYSQFGIIPTAEELEKGVPGAEGTVEEHKFKLDLFKTCDVDKDNFLSLEEFQAFSRPEDFNHTQGLEISRILHEHDTNKDGAIDVKEFLHAELHEDDPKEWIEIETERFHTNWDSDKDGVLKGIEIRAWLMPSNKEVASEEIIHLFSVADENKDSVLDLEEIIKHHETFGGSQATNWGKHIVDEL